MNSDEHQDVLRQLAELRKESRIRNRWIVFIAICVGLPLFLPQIAMWVATFSTRVIDYSGSYLAPITATFAVIIVAAVIVSRFAPHPPNLKPESDDA